MFSTDIDDTIVSDFGDRHCFQQAWETLGAHERPLLVYNSGRSVVDTEWLVLQHRLPPPEFVIGSIGTEVHDPIDASVAGAFRAHIAEGWDRDTVEKIVQGIQEARLQPSAFLNDYKLSWHWHRASRAELFRLEYRLKEAGLDVTVSYTNSVFLDIIPRHAGKGNALAWLCDRIGVPTDEIIVAGASANNIGMFALPRVRGILVGNASAELFDGARNFRPFVACEKAAAGVLAGLRHFGVLPASARQAEPQAHPTASVGAAGWG